MSAIIKLHTRKNKNSLLQHSSCSVQTQDYQISLKKRNIFCLAWKDCLVDATAHGLGGSSSSLSWELKLLWWCWAANSTLSECITASCTHWNTWDRSSHLQPQSTTKSGHGLVRKNGAAPPWKSLRLLPRAWPAEHRSLYWCYWEKQLQSDYYFCRADIEIPILRFFSHKYFWQFSLQHKYFHHYSCPEDTALLQNIPRADPRNQHWTSVERMHQFRLPGFVSSPGGTPTRQWLKSAWSFVWIIKCPFSELEDRNVPELGKI